MPVPEELVELLRCLECGSQLDEDGAVLVCRSCRLRYPIEGDIPVMLIDAARRGDTAYGHRRSTVAAAPTRGGLRNELVRRHRR